MSGSLWYNEKGEPIKLEEANEILIDSVRRKVGKDTVHDTLGHQWLVSTVFLVLNHQWGEGPPILFETMVFGPGLEDVYQERYSTREEAEAGHKDVCAMVKTWPEEKD